MKTTLSRRTPGRRGAETKKMASHVIKLGRAQYEYHTSLGFRVIAKAK